VDYTLETQVHLHEEKINKLEEAQDKIEAAIKVGANNPNITDAELESFEELKKKNNHISQAIADEHMVIQKLKVNALNTSKNEIYILKELWSGTKITLSNVKTIVRTSVLKPRLVKLERKKIKILPLGEGNMPDE